jgi:protein-S-isoprenylcysteine O-methyltransferase Ste14
MVMVPMDASDLSNWGVGALVLVKQMPVYLCVVVGWVSLLAFFCWHALTHPMPLGKKVDLASLVGAGMQLFSFWGLWLDHRKAGLPEWWAWEARLVVGVLGVALVCGCVGWIVWSTRTLGANWSLEASVAGRGRLVTKGPYRMIRHPIYVGFLVLLCLTLVTVGKPVSVWLFLGAYLVGMAVRVRREDRLLAEVFGWRFEAYRKRVPGLVPSGKKAVKLPVQEEEPALMTGRTGM